MNATNTTEPRDERFDVIVVGAGIAGSALARFLAQAGRKVALVDRRSVERAGARWVNGVPARAFAAVGVPLPVWPERLSGGHRFTVAGPSGRTRIHLDQHDVLEVDMRLLGERLRRDAEQAGATLRMGAPVSRVRVQGGRPVAIELGERTLSAPLFVDASGIGGVVRRAVFPDWPALPPDHLCLAAQEVRTIADIQGAMDFMRRHRIEPGEVYARTGVDGGFSLLNVRVDLDAHGKGHVAILTGSVRDRSDRPTGAEILARFVAAERWIGETEFGGAAAVPLTRPLPRIASPGLVLLGDAASMVYPAHASGIAIGLRAARMLADTLAEAGSNFASEQTTWSFAARFHRRHGGLLAAYDAFRRLSQSFGPEESEAIMASGLLSAEMVMAGLVQSLPTPRLGDVVSTLRGTLAEPMLALRVGRVLATMPLILAHAARYPRTPDVAALAGWERTMAALLGEEPKPVDGSALSEHVVDIDETHA